MKTENQRAYYKAYDERYKTIHSLGHGWASEEATPIVGETIRTCRIGRTTPILEVGCGEGRDAIPLMEQGYDLTAIDVSGEAIAFCVSKAPVYADRFRVTDCLDAANGPVEKRFGFIYSVAVVHMLVRDEDRNGFYRFIRDRLTDDGIALICCMGDGTSEVCSDEREAFTLQERDHPSGRVAVAATSLRMVSFPHFEEEIENNGLRIIKTGITQGMPDFNRLMYALVKKSGVV